MAAAVSSVSCLVLFDTHKATKAVRRHFLAEKNFRQTILAPACVPTTLFARTWNFSAMRISWYIIACNINKMASVTLAAKKQKRECHFYNKWIKEFKGIGKSSKGINQINNEKVDLQSK